MAEGATPPVLNPESVWRYDIGPCHAADTRQRTTKHDVFFETLAEADSDTFHRAVLSSTVNYDFSGFSIE